MAVRGLGCPVAMALTGGHRGDAPQADALIEGRPARFVMADVAYDADRLRALIERQGGTPVMPHNPSRSIKHPFDRTLYAERHLVECRFSRLKQFRRVATRYAKAARNYLAVVTIAATVLWLRQCPRDLRADTPNRGAPRGAVEPR